MKIIRHSDTCQIKNVKSSKMVEAVIMDFSDKKYLKVVINQSIKLSMVWNGRYYEGQSAGMDFESAGPQTTKTQTGIRG